MQGCTVARQREGLDMLLKIGKGFEVEVTLGSLLLRIGRFERYWNAGGLPTH